MRPHFSQRYYFLQHRLVNRQSATVRVLYWTFNAILITNSNRHDYLQGSHWQSDRFLDHDLKWIKARLVLSFTSFDPLSVFIEHPCYSPSKKHHMLITIEGSRSVHRLNLGLTLCRVGRQTRGIFCEWPSPRHLCILQVSQSLDYLAYIHDSAPSSSSLLYHNPTASTPPVPTRPNPFLPSN